MFVTRSATTWGSCGYLSVPQRELRGFECALAQRKCSLQGVKKVGNVPVKTRVISQCVAVIGTVCCFAFKLIFLVIRLQSCRFALCDPQAQFPEGDPPPSLSNELFSLATGRHVTSPVLVLFTVTASVCAKHSISKLQH